MIRTALAITQTITPSEVGPLRRRVASAVADTGAGKDIVAAVRACVSEALANAAMHAYTGESGSVDVLVEIDDERIVVTVRDEGRGFGGAPTRVREEGGLGLEIIGKLTEHLRVTSESGGGTELCMIFVEDEGSLVGHPREPSK